jgi:hypothetical protein
MERTWKPVTAGILSILAGALDIAVALLLLLVGGTLMGILAANGAPAFFSLIPLPVLGLAATPLFILGTIAIIGGSCAIRRRTWPLALAGALCALFPPQVTLLGVLSIVFVVLGKDEFH